MPPGKNSAYGRQIFDGFSPRSVNGRTIIVGATGVAGYESTQRIFTPDSFGRLRFFTTLAAAIAAGLAGRDTIYVMAGHTETISSSTALNLSLAGVQIVGMGTGSLRPKLTLDTSTGSTITVSGANCSIENFVIDATGIDSIVAVLTISAAGFSFKNNKVILANSTNQATVGIVTTAGASDLVVAGNRFEGTSDAGTTAAITLVGGDNITIVDNDFVGAYGSGVGAIRGLTTLTTNAIVKRNTIVNLTASATKGITLLTGSTGIISDNRFGIGSGAAPITADACWWNANYSSAAVATNGTLV